MVLLYSDKKLNLISKKSNSNFFYFLTIKHNLQLFFIMMLEWSYFFEADPWFDSAVSKLYFVQFY